MLRTATTIACIALLAGCVDVTPIARPDGKTGYTIECDGESQACFDKAGDLCPSGYYLVERKSGTNELKYTAGLVSAPRTQLLIECK
jgi:hypothetical protein